MLTYVASSSPILDDTDTSTIEYGILVGPAFLAVIGIFTIITGRLVDMFTRPKILLVFFLSLASIATFFTAFANSFLGLLWPRILYAAVVAGADPCVFKLIHHYFSSE